VPRRWVPRPGWPGRLLAAGLLAVADQAIKAVITATLPAGAEVPVVPGVLTLTHVHNRGVAFGLLPGVPPGVLGLAAGLLAGLLIWRGGAALGTWQAGAGSVLVLGGTAGNLADRLRRGYVIDYVDLHVWPVFNLADAAIVAGSVLLAAGMLRGTGNARAVPGRRDRRQGRPWR